jgi:hypothetical protein
MNKLKDFTRKITPRFIWKLLSIIKRTVYPNGATSLKKIDFTKNHNDVIVLGNGPSLKNDLEDIVKKADTHDFVCVNNFCSTTYYTTFKPSIYVFLDDYFFSKIVHEMWIVQRKKTFKIINEETTWPMKIFLPFGADENILKEFITNDNIEIIKMNVFSSSKINLYNSGYFGPEQCNVLIYAVYLAIWAKYKNIKIYGADMSFHKDIDVDQKDNSLVMIFKHFNSEDTVEKCMKNPERIVPFTATEIMKTTADTFNAHELLNCYAEEKNITIINFSSYSFVDAYRRPRNKDQ